MSFPVYKAEIEAGLGDILYSRARVIAGLARVKEAQPFHIATEVEKSLLRSTAKAGPDSPDDLKYLSSILVSTGWNLNDDIFDTEEVWLARHTPEDKPLNYGHIQDDIVGHLTSNRCLTKAGDLIADATALEDLPEEYDIGVDGVLYYGYWEDADKKKRIDAFIKQIKEEKLFVSMECLFGAFDYGLKDKNGNQKVIARNRTTAFLTKHLRAYGGSGEYDGHRVGRLLRKITFSGKGLVEQPANPDSLILSVASTKFISVSALSVYPTPTQKEKVEMSQQTQPDANAAIELLKQTHATELKTLADAKAKLEADLADVTRLKDEAVAHAASLEQKSREDSRTTKAKNELSLDEEKAKAFVLNTANLTDEAFDATIALVKTKPIATAAVVTPDLSQATQTTTPAPNPAKSDEQTKATLATEIQRFLSFKKKTLPSSK